MHQQRRVVELRRQLAAASQADSILAPPVDEAAVSPGTGARATPLTEAEKLQLLRLRAEVSRLRQAVKSTATTRNPSHAPGATNVINAAVPPSYRLAAQWEFKGFESPEAAIESFFWAARNRDTNAITQALPPAPLAATGTKPTLVEFDSVFNAVGNLPGIQLLSTRLVSDTEAEVELQFDPRPDGLRDKLKCRRIGVEWRLDMFR